MFCKECGRQIEDGSKFCIYCGAKMPEYHPERMARTAEPRETWKAEPDGITPVYTVPSSSAVPPEDPLTYIGADSPDAASGTGRRGLSKKALIILIVLAVVVAGAGGKLISVRVENNRRRQEDAKITDAKLKNLADSIYGAGSDILNFLDPFILCIERGQPAGMDTVDARVNCNILLQKAGTAKSNYKNMTGKAAWDPVKYKVYEDMYSALEDTVALMDKMYEGDPIYKQNYSRGLIEERRTPYEYKCSDPEALREEFEDLRQRFTDCLSMLQ